jgi:hypothetical protein
MGKKADKTDLIECLAQIAYDTDRPHISHLSWLVITSAVASAGVV